MDIQYAHDQFYTAVRSILLTTTPIRDKFISGFFYESIQRIQYQDTPEHIAQQIQKLQHKMINAHESITRNIDISDIAILEIFDEVLDIYDQIASIDK